MAGSSSGAPVMEEEDASELKLGELFVNAKCLMNAEVQEVLERKFEERQQQNGHAQMSQLFFKCLGYVKRVNRYQNPDAVHKVREMLARNHLHEFELCVIGNLCPVTVQEAKGLVPSLAKRGRMNHDQLESMLNDLWTVRKFE